MRIKITTINENSEYERCKARHGERLAKIICRIARRYKTVRIETDDIEYVSHKPDDDTKEYFHIIYRGNIIYVKNTYYDNLNQIYTANEIKNWLSNLRVKAKTNTENMKKFDIEKAKNGAAVCMRDGTPVKILDFDYNGSILFKYQSGEPEDGVTMDNIGTARQNGKACGVNPNAGTKNPKDLFMAQVYGYMNVFKNEDNKVFVGGVIRASEQDCIDAGKEDLLPGNKWFCVARVELMPDEEGGAK